MTVGITVWWQFGDNPDLNNWSGAERTMGAPNSTFFTSLSPPLASFFFSPSASTAGLPSQCFWVWGGMALSVPSFTQIPRIDWIFWSPDVEKFSSVFVENRSCLRLSTWLRGLAPCQGLTDCKATLFQGGLGKPLYKKSAVQTEIRRKGGGLKTHSKWNVGVLQWI